MSEGTPFFRAGGTMEPGAPSYIERQADTDLFDALVAREFVFLLDSRQKGKSSMVARTIIRLREVGVSTVKLDLQRIGANVSAEQWYGGLLTAFGHDLGVTEALFSYWAQHQAVGPLARWLGALEHVVLPEISGPLVVFIDEVDFVRALPFPTDEFFAGIRDCYNRRAEGSGFDRLTFCLVGVATPGQLIRNPEVTPFNIGKRIDISDFTPEESDGYAPKLSAGGRDGLKLKRRVDYWLAGHPYLTQLLCSHIASDGTVRTHKDVDILVRRLFLTPEARQREANLSDVERRILEPDVPGLAIDERRTQVLELYGRVLHGRKVEVAEENPVVATLRLSGVGLEDKHALRLRNRLYGLVFDENWRRNSLPDAELRRQRGAAKVALLRTAAVAGVLIMAVTTVALNTNRLATERSRALTDLGHKSSELERTANERKAALEDLGRKAGELEGLSAEQRQSLGKISDLNRNLEIESSGRLKTIDALNQTTAELARKSYDTTFFLIQDALEKSQSDRAGKLVKTIEKSPYRGWEWQYLMASMSLPPVVAELGVRTYLEKDDDGHIQLASPKGLYDVDGRTLRFVRPFNQTLAEEAKKKYAPYVSGVWAFPAGREGKYRVWWIAYRNVLAIEDAATDEILVNRTTDRQIFSIDPVRHQYLSQPKQQETASIVEVRSIKDDKLIREVKFDPPINEIIRITPSEYIAYRTTQDKKTKILILDNELHAIGNACECDGTFQSLGVSKDGSMLALLLDDKLEIRKKSDLSLVFQCEEKETITFIDFSEDLKEFVYSVGNGTIRRCELKTGKVLASYLGSEQRVMYVAYTKGGREILSVDNLGRVRFWPMTANMAPKLVAAKGLMNTAAHFKHPERLVWTDLKSIHSWDPVSGKEQVRAIDGLAMVAGTDGVAFQPADDPRYIVAGFRDGTVQVIEPTTLKTTRTMSLFGKKSWTFVGQLSDPRFVVASDASAPIKKGDRTPMAVINVETGEVKSRFLVPASPMIQMPPQIINSCVAISPFNSKDIFVVNIDSGNVVKTLRMQDIIFRLECSHNGKVMVVGTGRPVSGADAKINIMRTDRFQVEAVLDCGDQLGAIEFSPDDNWIAWHGRTGWQVSELGRSENSFHFDGTDIRDLSFSPDGQRILTIGLRPESLTLWDAKNGSELMRLPSDSTYNANKNNYFLLAPMFIQDGRTIVLPGGDGSLRAWQLPQNPGQRSAARK